MRYFNPLGYSSNGHYDHLWLDPEQRLDDTTIAYSDWGTGLTVFGDARLSKLKFNGSWEVDFNGPDNEGFLIGDYYDSRY